MSTSTSKTASTSSCNSSQKDSFEAAFNLSQCSEAEAVGSWSESCKGELWLSKEKKRMIRDKAIRSKSQQVLDLESDEELDILMCARTPEVPPAEHQRASFSLRRPDLPMLSATQPRTQMKGSSSRDLLNRASPPGPSTPRSSNMDSSPPSWLKWSVVRKVKGLMQKKHKAAWLDYQTSSSLDSRSFCLDSASVDLF
jgi:hypothetical protein